MEDASLIAARKRKAFDLVFNNLLLWSEQEESILDELGYHESDPDPDLR